MLKGTKEVAEACNRQCNGKHEHSVIEGSMKLPSGKRCNVSEWAGGYTNSFAMSLLRGAERFMEKHYGVKKCVKEYHDTHPARRVVRFGPEEEHYASSDESEHEESDPEEVRSYTRVDQQAKRFRTTTEQGPKWSTAVRRVTYDLRTGELLETLDGED